MNCQTEKAATSMATNANTKPGVVEPISLTET